MPLMFGHSMRSQWALDPAITYLNHGTVGAPPRRVTRLVAPESAIGVMVAVPMPPQLGSTSQEASRLRDALLFDDHIEVQISARKSRLLARISAQIYNEMADIERLIEAVDRRL